MAPSPAPSPQHALPVDETQSWDATGTAFPERAVSIACTGGAKDSRRYHVITTAGVAESKRVPHDRAGLDGLMHENARDQAELRQMVPDEDKAKKIERP